MNEGALLAALLIPYAVVIISIAFVRSSPAVLWWLCLPLVPFLLVLAVIGGIVALFGGAAGAAVKQETGWKADGTRAYPYHIKRDD
jgi:hypothetical protein